MVENANTIIGTFVVYMAVILCSVSHWLRSGWRAILKAGCWSWWPGRDSALHSARQ
ncbi:MAG TPA: hypothetical protein VGA68_11090 [Woeseiaceae bacterium]|jgi:hypothetical protein